ncbi:MAG TPA: glycosyltransferase [Ignavibacteriaceae bacterium]|nr:glycosyltransferase [Ignavibacteriaceae bacterium]
MKIALITSGHPPLDERIYWKFGKSLAENNNEITIICSTQAIEKEIETISIIGFVDIGLSKKDKIDKFYNLLIDIKPDVIICFEHFPVFSAYKYKKYQNNLCKIILDITEWYPENVAQKNKFNVFTYLKYYFNNILTSNLANALIIGEITKKRRYDYFAPTKEKIIIGYYPILKYFPPYYKEFNKKELVLCYAGLIKLDRGILNIIDAAEEVRKKYMNFEIKILVIGKFEKQLDEDIFDLKVEQTKKIKIVRVGWFPYNEFSNNLKDVHICLDLRTKNFIYNNSLPIKLFEYMALGKPFIYSDVPPIRKELKEIDEYGFLVDPDNISEVVNRLHQYINNPSLMILQGMNNRKLIEEKLNWEEESKKLINFVNRLTKSE